jgi:hypothetical protein
MQQLESDRAATEHAMGKPAGEQSGMEIMGPLHHPQFPKRSVKCGTFTARTLVVTKLFWWTSTRDRPSYYVIGAVSAPLCMACI